MASDIRLEVLDGWSQLERMVPSDKRGPDQLPEYLASASEVPLRDVLVARSLRNRIAHDGATSVSDAQATQAAITIRGIQNALNASGGRRVSRKAADPVVHAAAALWIEIDRFSEDASCEPTALELALDDLGHELTTQGPHDDAIRALTHTVQTLRLLTEAKESAISPLAQAIGILCEAHRMAGRFETALSLAEEHVRLRRPAMSNTATPEQRFHYARALAQIGRNLHLLDRHHEAAATLEKAITIIRESGREQWLPSLAEYLRLRSRCLRIIGRAEEALASAEEVVTLETQLRLDDPVGDPSHLARALEDLAYCLSKLERYSDAASASREAVSLRRQPTANESTDARYDLARTLGQYSFNAERAGQLSAAIAANEEEVALRRSLPLRDVTSDASDLAWALHNLAFLLEDAGRFAEALPIAEEAINRYQRLQQAGLLGSDGEHEFTLATKTLGRLRQTPQGGQEGIDSQFFAGHWQEEMDDGSVLEWSLRLNGSFAARFVSINPSYRLIVKRWYGEWQVSLDDPLDQWIELVATDIDSGVLLGFFGALAGRSEAPKETLDRLTRSANIINFIERGFTLSWTGYSGTERYTSTWKML